MVLETNLDQVAGPIERCVESRREGKTVEKRHVPGGGPKAWWIGNHGPIAELSSGDKVIPAIPNLMSQGLVCGGLQERTRRIGKVGTWTKETLVID